MGARRLAPPTTINLLSVLTTTRPDATTTSLRCHHGRPSSYSPATNQPPATQSFKSDAESLPSKVTTVLSAATPSTMEAESTTPHHTLHQGGYPRRSTMRCNPCHGGRPCHHAKAPHPRQRRSRRRRSLHLAENTAVSHPRSSSERAVRSTLQQPRSNGLGHGSAAEPARMPAHGEDFTELPAMRGERDEGRTLGETEKNRH
jgi:hypothetical protein